MDLTAINCKTNFFVLIEQLNYYSNIKLSKLKFLNPSSFPDGECLKQNLNYSHDRNGDEKGGVEGREGDVEGHVLAKVVTDLGDGRLEERSFDPVWKISKAKGFANRVQL